MRRDSEFWARVAITGVLVNAPLAWAVVLGGVHVGVALVLSMVSGSALTAIWDRGVHRARIEEPATC